MPEAISGGPAAEPSRPATSDNSESAHDAEVPRPAAAEPRTKRPLWIWIAGGVVVLLALTKVVPFTINAFRTVSTDDAYVNGHLTFVAPRVPGQVVRVLVDDNNRVQRGNLLVQLDKEPYRVQLDIAKAELEVAQADLIATQAKVRGLAGLARSERFELAQSIEKVHDQVADLHAKVAALQSANEKLVKAQSSKAEQEVYQIRAELGLPPKPANGGDLADVPPDLDQHFSAVKEAQNRLMETAAQLGVVQPFKATPDEMLAEFYKRDPSGNIDIILNQVLSDAPDVKQAQAKLDVTQANLHQAELNLAYCDVVADIGGVVTSRNVNPGNHVVAGEQLMALRSLTEIWVDANFKETQLAKLRIGQPVDLDVDMYGGKRRFQGRISGFTMGTGSTLALLPAENATGNFVKVVQRLPVRIEVLNYDPDKTPLFIGTSVVP